MVWPGSKLFPPSGFIAITISTSHIITRIDVYLIEHDIVDTSMDCKVHLPAIDTQKLHKTQKIPKKCVFFNGFLKF